MFRLLVVHRYFFFRVHYAFPFSGVMQNNHFAHSAFTRICCESSFVQGMLDLVKRDATLFHARLEMRMQIGFCEARNVHALPHP